MLGQLTNTYHLHPIVDHFTIALLASGIAAEMLAAAAILFAHGKSDRLSQWSQNLAGTSLLLMIGGGAAAVLSYLTGDAEADRLWDSMSPAAHHILASSDGAGRYLSHSSRRIPYVLISAACCMARADRVFGSFRALAACLPDGGRFSSLHTPLPREDWWRAGLRTRRWNLGASIAGQNADRRLFKRSWSTYLSSGARYMISSRNYLKP